MADPRAAVSNAGIGAEYMSFWADNSTITYSASTANGSTAAGKAVTLSTDDTVALAADGNAVVGKLISVEADLVALVQVEGVMTLPAGVGASLTLTKQIVGAVDGSGNRGYIREVATGTAAELGLCRGMILNNDTTTAVVVML